MAESAEDIAGRLDAAVAAGFRGRLLDRGLARGLIWNSGTVPDGAPTFVSTLTDDLLDYAHTVLALAVRLRTLAPDHPILERAFLVAGEAIEAAIHRGANGPQVGFHRVSAAVAFHLARYSARAFSLLPSPHDIENLAPTERALVDLLLRRFGALRQIVASWLLDPTHLDDGIAAALADNDGFDESDAVSTVLTTAYMRGLALFDHAITTGNAELALAAREQLRTCASDARTLNAVSHWWTASLAAQLVDDLWSLSLHRRLAALPDAAGDALAWLDLRSRYIHRLRMASRAAIELWPSQLEAATRALDPADDLIVALPTSAGKTRIAELCILRTLASGRRAVYVTPLRALSAQIESDLGQTFRPLGITVSSLYGSAGVELGDADTLRESQIVVATPEKLDFALRNDNSIIDTVGLVVLDEGHMLGPGEREVRYEALVQRLTRRDDAAGRRLVCLSALFPSPEDMVNLTAWLRSDEPGDPIHSRWRPTRQRFGVLRWTGGAGRLEVRVEEESPYVPRFIESSLPPTASRRRRPFPDNKNELTLATAWRFVEQGKKVMIYCALRASVETLGKRVLKCIEHGVLRPLNELNDRIADAMATGVEWLGPNHPAVECLRYGVALHHGGLPRQYLTEVERLLRSGDCPLVVASPTLAQGLNLSASVLLVPSIWRNAEMIPPTEFANVAGRAGRAFVDVEGLVVHIVWDRPDYSIRNWEQLLRDARAPKIVSGILELTVRIYQRLANMVGMEADALLDHVTGQDQAWDFVAAPQNGELSEPEWDRDIASLDSAVLALLEADSTDLQQRLDDVLERSLFVRQLENYEAASQQLIRRVLIARATRIWINSTVAQRRGYHAAGVGLKAGRFLDLHIETLSSLLSLAEAGLMAGVTDVLATSVVDFAALALSTAPFVPPKGLPGPWQAALDGWMRGLPSGTVLTLCGEDGADVLQEAFIYRLPWAMEAVRVHALAIGHPLATELTGMAALAVEVGSDNRSVIALVRAGLNSREAAMAAVQSTAAQFVNREGMVEWLRSAEVLDWNNDPNWPTPGSRHAWLQFLRDEDSGELREWSADAQNLNVVWDGEVPMPGTAVTLREAHGSRDLLVLSPALDVVGRVVRPALRRPLAQFTNAFTLADAGRPVRVEFFGVA